MKSYNKKLFAKTAVAILLTLLMLTAFIVNSVADAVHFGDGQFIDIDYIVLGEGSTAVTHSVSDYSMHFTQAELIIPGKFFQSIEARSYTIYTNYTPTASGTYFDANDNVIRMNSNNTWLNGKCDCNTKWTSEAASGNIFDSEFYVIHNTNFQDNWYFSESFICVYDSSRALFGWRVW